MCDCFDWKILTTIREQSSIIIFRDDNIFFLMKNDFSFACKTFSACFSMIFKINYDNKLKKWTTDWADFEKSVNEYYFKNNVNRTI